jgi:hypothetical protein
MRLAWVSSLEGVDSVTGFIATGSAVGVIAALMYVGIKMKPPPPDPDWRDHLPLPPLRPSRGWLIFLFSPLVGFFLGVVALGVATAMGADRFTERLIPVLLALLVLRVVATVSWTVHAWRQQRRATLMDATEVGHP